MVQEVSTRFGTRFDCVKRFVKSEKQLNAVLNQLEGDAVTKIKDLLSELTREHDDEGYHLTALSEIGDTFAPIRHVQVELESYGKPTLLKVLPMLENLKQNLSLVSSGVSTGPNLEKHHELTILLSVSYTHLTLPTILLV